MPYYENDEDLSIPTSAMPEENNNDDDLSIPQESYGRSLKKAPGRIASDIYQSAENLYHEVPGFLKSTKEGILNLPKTNLTHPLHAAGQALAGTNELINQIAQFPLNVSKYGSERLHITPQSITDVLQKITPQDTTNAIHQIFGEPKYSGESMIRGFTRNAVPEMAIVKGASLINPLKYTNKAITKDIIKTGEKNKDYYSNEYNNLFKEAENKGFDHALNNVDIDMNVLNKYTPK
jgi:hypothetical protein